MNVYILNTLGSGIDIIRMINKEICISGIIGLRGAIQSGYQHDLCQQTGIPYIEVSAYNLSRDQDRLMSLCIDVLIVAGWQRLIPQWLIQHCGVCVGVHGSPWGITKGRGRSPQNWALLMGMDSFTIAIFRIDAGVDSGRVYDSQTYQYSVHDNIQTSYYKACILTAQMLIKLIQTGDFVGDNQPEGAEYLPQRTESDGGIDWRCTMRDIRNFIRALTRPYPGAYTLLDGHRMIIYDAVPFVVNIPQGNTGEVVFVFHSGHLLVQCGDGHMLVTDYVICDVAPTAGRVFSSVSHYYQLCDVIQRHESKHPHRPVSSVLQNYVSKLST